MLRGCIPPTEGLELQPSLSDWLHYTYMFEGLSTIGLRGRVLMQHSKLVPYVGMRLEDYSTAQGEPSFSPQHRAVPESFVWLYPSEPSFQTLSKLATYA